jgi:hypothetical protein
MTTATTPDVLSEDERSRFAVITSRFRAAIACDAVEIRSARVDLRARQREGSALAPVIQSRLHHRRVRARARLIAYGLHRGVALERIEHGRTTMDDLPWHVRTLVPRVAREAAG